MTKYCVAVVDDCDSFKGFVFVRQPFISLARSKAKDLGFKPLGKIICFEEMKN